MSGSDGTVVLESELRPPHERGALTIAPRVVEKIVERSLNEVEHIVATARGGPLTSITGQPDRSARVRARVDGATVLLDVACAVAYPAPVARTARQARAVIMTRVSELTGLRPRQVDITVDALVVTTAPTRTVR